MTPDQYTSEEFFLDVGDGHQIYVHDWGNKDAKNPILFLHGGPGNGCYDRDKNTFDPRTQRVIFHDQRGSGKSLPKGSLENNNSQALVSDIAKITDKLEIENFILYGGSWGSTLALLTAIAYPDQVSSIVVHGVFTASQEEIRWVDRGGFRKFFPEIWEDYIKSVPADNQEDPSAYHFQKALGTEPEAAKQSIYEYQKVELAILKLDDQYTPGSYEEFDPTNGKIEIHYLANKCFLEGSYILDNVHKLAMPVYLVHGRYDIVCPPDAAYKLHKALPNSNLIWTINGHLRQHEAKNVTNLLLKQLSGD